MLLLAVVQVGTIIKNFKLPTKLIGGALTFSGGGHGP
jgi:hypothetical protein